MENNNNYDIVMTQWVAPEGTALLIYNNADKLKQHFPPYLIDDTMKLTNSILLDRERVVETISRMLLDKFRGIYGYEESFELITREYRYMIPEDEGFYDMLWYMGESFSSGLVIHMEKVPVLQMSVEICDHLKEDLFELSMRGSLFMICPEGYEMAERIKEAGYNAACIGNLTNNNDRIIKDGERTTFITPPERRKAK